MQYHNITKDDMLNGDGLRVVLWVAGCGHACPGCHNPITWDENGGLPFDERQQKRDLAGLARTIIPATFSGGDPSIGKPEQVGALAREVHARFPEKTIWLYTGCRLSRDRRSAVPDAIDVIVVVLGPFIESQKNTQLCWRQRQSARDVRRTGDRHGLSA